MSLCSRAHSVCHTNAPSHQFSVKPVIGIGVSGSMISWRCTSSTTMRMPLRVTLELGVDEPHVPPARVLVRVRRRHAGRFARSDWGPGSPAHHDRALPRCCDVYLIGEGRKSVERQVVDERIDVNSHQPLTMVTGGIHSPLTLEQLFRDHRNGRVVEEQNIGEDTRTERCAEADPTAPMVGSLRSFHCPLFLPRSELRIERADALVDGANGSSASQSVFMCYLWMDSNLIEPGKAPILSHHTMRLSPWKNSVRTKSADLLKND